MTKGKFSRTLKAGARKTDNAPGRVKAKIELRGEVLAWIGPDQAQVFDAFSGDGGMHAAVWHAAAGYVGCDEKWYRDERTTFVADNRRVMRAIDLARFNVFDFDAYGAPGNRR